VHRRCLDSCLPAGSGHRKCMERLVIHPVVVFDVRTDSPNYKELGRENYFLKSIGFLLTNGCFWRIYLSVVG
jgi:hypothetical protein